MKRIVVLALLLACRKAHDEPRQAPPQPAAPAAPAAAPTTPAAPKAPATAPATAPALQPIAGVLPVAGDFTIKDFTFASGEKLPELRIHYMTLGTLKRDASGHAANA